MTNILSKNSLFTDAYLSKSVDFPQNIPIFLFIPIFLPMFKIINFFKARPSDHTIKMLRILIGLWLSALLGLGCMTYEILPGVLSDTTELIVKYVLIMIAILPVLW